MRILLLFWIILFLAPACKDEKVPIFYAETKCADPWGLVGNSDEALREAVTEWLDLQDLPEYCNLEVNSDNQFAQSCEACICTTGRIISLEVEVEDKPTFLELGFQEGSFQFEQGH